MYILQNWKTSILLATQRPTGHLLAIELPTAYVAQENHSAESSRQLFSRLKSCQLYCSRLVQSALHWPIALHRRIGLPTLFAVLPQPAG
jgi:hypothetical protein